MIGARVVEPLAIRNEHAEYRAQFEQLMPVPVIAGQARSIEAHHKTGVAKADLGNELLETMTWNGPVKRGPPARVVISADMPTTTPPECFCPHT